jgi:TonB family protein
VRIGVRARLLKFRAGNQMATERLRLPNLGREKQTKQSSGSENTRQSRHLLIALALLLVVLAFVVMRNRDFWFGSNDVAESDTAASESITASKPASSTPSKPAMPVAKMTQATASHAASAASYHSEKNLIPTATAKPASQPTADSEQPVVASNRVALPPLDVEVVAGDKHSRLHPGTNSTVAEITDANNTILTASAASVSSNAAERERLAVAAPELRQSIDAVYPVLSQHSRVQGSVVLEAVIATDGSIEGLRVLSGPAILSAAAQQAVREWRFKPYLQNGQPVETKCQVTVNFSIRVSDDSTKAS